MRIIKISIIGAGSIGLLYGAYLSRHHKVTFYVRNLEQLNEINNNGVQIIGNTPCKNINAKLISEFNGAELIILTLKQTVLESFIKENSSFLEGVPLIFLQNGLSHLNYIDALDFEISIGIVDHGASKVSHTKVKHLGKGETKLATYNMDNEKLRNIANMLTETDFKFKVYDNWQSISYKKLVINATINPLTAIFNIKNGELLESNYLKKIAKKLCFEASTTLNLVPVDEWESVKSIIIQTAKNTSSMCADLNNNRITEIDAITGYILNISQEETPYSSAIYNTVKYLEERGK